MTDNDMIDIISNKRTLTKSGHIGLTLAKEVIDIVRADERAATLERCIQELLNSKTGISTRYHAVEILESMRNA